MGISVFRIRTAVDFPPVLKSDHTMRSCRAASLHAGRPGVLSAGTDPSVEAPVGSGCWIVGPIVETAWAEGAPTRLVLNALW